MYEQFDNDGMRLNKSHYEVAGEHFHQFIQNVMADVLAMPKL